MRLASKSMKGDNIVSITGRVDNALTSLRIREWGVRNRDNKGFPVQKLPQLQF